MCKQVEEETGEVEKITTKQSEGKNEKSEELTVGTTTSPDSLNEDLTSKEEIKEVAIQPATNTLEGLTPQALTALDYTDFSTPARMLALGEILVKSKMCPLKKAEDVVVALLCGKELGLPFIASINEIYPINGSPTLGVHILKGICLSNGIVFEKTRDYEEYYEFVETDENGKVKLSNSTDATSYNVISKGFIDKQPKNTKRRVIDFITEYTLTRKIKQIDGTYKNLIAKGSFSLLEAKQAELLTKDNWNKYPKRMLEARAFAVASREIADDLLHGIMLPDEVE